MDAPDPSRDYDEPSDWALPRLTGPQFRRLVARHWTTVLRHDDCFFRITLPMQKGGDA